MHSCGHKSNFLSDDPDSIGQQNAMSKSGQKTTTNEGSPTATAKPCLVSREREQRSEEISSQSLGSRVNPGNADERREVVIATRQLVLPDSNSEIGHSQASRQENSPQESRQLVLENQNQTESDERKYWYSKRWRKLAASSPELKNMEYTNHHYMSMIFQCLQKKLGMSATNATFSMDAYRTHVLIWGMFVTSSMKAAIHLGPNFLSNSEIYKSTKFEDIETVCNITQKLLREHSEDLLNVKCLEYSSPSWVGSVLANDQGIKWAKAKVCVYADSVLCVGQICQDAVGIDGEAIEFEWKIVPGFSSLSIHEKIQEDPETQRIRKEILRRTLDIIWSRIWKKSGMEVLTTITKDYGIVQLTKWYNETKKMVIFAWSRGVLKQKQGKTSIHFNSDSMNTELLFQTVSSFCKSAQCPRSRGDLVLSIRFHRRREGTS